MLAGAQLAGSLRIEKLLIAGALLGQLLFPMTLRRTCSLSRRHSPERKPENILS
jgi:hypothetical protein